MSARFARISPRLRPQNSSIIGKYNLASTTIRYTSTKAARSIAIIGAGLSGLSHALYLARGLSDKGRRLSHKIVVYESSDRSGGWVNSQRVDVGDGTTALVEKGPRSIRAVTSANGLAMLELLTSLKLSPQLIDVSKEHPSAKNRMVWYDGKLHKLPNDFRSLTICVTTPGHFLHGLFQLGDIWAILRNLRNESDDQSRKRSAEWFDESVEETVKRVFDTSGKESRGMQIVDRTISAVLHGIYAADPSQLSVRATLPFAFNFLSLLTFSKRSWWPPWPFNIQMHTIAQAASEPKTFPWARRALRKHERETLERRTLRKILGTAVIEAFKNTSVLSFRDGLQTLTDALHAECVAKGIEVRLKTPVTSISITDDDKASVTTAQHTEHFDRLVSALPSSKLADTLEGLELPNLKANPSKTVCVVNIIVPKHLHVGLMDAFGFLVPRAVDKQGENPHGLLGVVFDSVAVPGQDGHTKLTMMFGGPYWRTGYVMHDIVTQKADGKRKGQEEAQRLLDSILLPADRSSHSFSFTNKAVVAKLHVQRDCIPTYLPGHPLRMFELHEALCSPKAVPLSVIGASYTGVSLNDCVLYARRTAERIVEAEKSNSLSVNVSGLEEYSGE